GGGGGVKAALLKNGEKEANGEFLETLKTHFPQFFKKDIYDEEGNLIESGGFKSDKFLDELKKSNAAESKDGYRLGFVGRDYARLQTGLASETAIIPDCGHNEKIENQNSGNVFITGDNLEALRHLQNAYANKIKMIYIDPPYNTGSADFTYSDKFEFDDEKLKNALGYSDEEIARLKSIQGKSSHSAWLTFMYPRLKIAQKLLREDGVIFVSIDDNEQANLKLLMDDVFGEGNFVSNIIWEKVRIRKNSALYFTSSHDFILCYAKKVKLSKQDNGWERNLLEREEGSYKNPDNDPNGAWMKGSVIANHYYDADYTIAKPNGVVLHRPKNGSWRYSEESIAKFIEENRMLWGDSKSYPMVKKYEKDAQNGIVPKTIITFKEVGGNPHAAEETKALFDDIKIFDNPKPVTLIRYLLDIAINKSDIILDFFAGSGTTAHAVMQLNAEDGGDRKFIMVQLDEPTNPTSEAKKAGYNTIDEISRERIKRAAQKIKSEAGLNAQNLDLGFKHFRLKTLEIKTLNKIIEFDPNNAGLFNEDMITPFAYPAAKTSGLDTLLATWLINDGFSFDTKIEAVNFANYQAHYIKDAAMIYLINQGWDTEALKVLLNQIGKNELCANTIIVYPYSFSFEAMRELKTNIKTNLPNPPVILERY
ncbi:MAG: site-specific DNA-methyltransferase, partial [Campylobacteraceae bacterium]|nr:site-specific DNA-methyltransferase [Campylobacteraceae bacterium]